MYVKFVDVVKPTSTFNYLNCSKPSFNYLKDTSFKTFKREPSFNYLKDTSFKTFKLLKHLIGELSCFEYIKYNETIIIINITTFIYYNYSIMYYASSYILFDSVFVIFNFYIIMLIIMLIYIS